MKRVGSRRRIRPAQMRRLDQVPELLKLYTCDRYVGKLFKAIVTESDHGGRCITPEKMQVLVGCSRPQAIQTLRAVGVTKVGEFKHGRKQFKTRLEWSFPYGAEEVIQELNNKLALLAKNADAGDKEAQDNLMDMATAAGVRRNAESAEDWAAVAKMIAPGNSGGHQAQGSDDSDSSTDLGSMKDDTVASQNPEDPMFVKTKILLRPDLWAILSLPKDLTENEAARLAGVVRNLWLVPSNGKEGGTPAEANE